MTDADIMAALTEISRELLDPLTRSSFERAEREGYHLTAFEVAGLVTPPALAPIIVVAHVAPRPSMAAIRSAYHSMRRRCAKETA